MNDMLIEVLHPHKVPQCGETIRQSYTSGQGKQCPFSAKYKIDGMKVCERHAKEYALRILLRQSQKS